MRGLLKMSLGETTRNVIMAVVYLVFFWIMGSSAVHAPDGLSRMIYLVMLLFFGAFGLLSEYLRFLNHKAIKTLVIDCNPAKALTQLAALEKADILKGYKNSNVVFRTLALVDENKPRELLDYIHGSASGTLQYSLDMRLIYYYNVFYGNLMLNNREGVLEIYPKLDNLKATKDKNKRHRVSPIYSWEVIKGDYLLATGEYAKAHRQFEQSATANMNNRELAHFYLSRASACAGMGHPREEQKYLKLARQAAPEMPRVLQYSGIGAAEQEAAIKD